MNRFFVALCIALSATSLVSAQSSNELSPGDEKAIRQLVATFGSGWNTHDMNAIASVFSDDAEFINVVGMHWHGKKAIVKSHSAYHETIFKDCKLHTDEVHVRPIGPDHAVMVSVHTQDTFTTPSGDVVPKHQNRMTWVVARQGKAWRVVHGQNTRIDAQAAQFDPANKK